MGKVIGPPIKKSDKEWILQQHLFFHATSPLSAKHHVNLSPKCSREFRIIDDHTVGWVDLTGSGSETAAHIMENGRLTILFVALKGSPRIVRLHGKGRIILPSDFNQQQNAHIIKHFEGFLQSGIRGLIGVRSIIILDVERASQSCGYSIPIFDFVSDRTTLDDVTAAKGCDGMREYRMLKNSFSIDGLPSIAQLEMAGTGTAPSEIEYNQGFIFAKKYSKNWLSNLWVKCNINWQHNDHTVSFRDTCWLVCGIAVGSLLGMQLQRWYRS